MANELDFKITMNENDHNSLIDELPNDWWRRKSSSEVLLDWFSRYLLGLFLTFEFGDKIQHTLYTGFLLYYREVLMWATAGHVIDEINKISSNANIRIKRMRWADNCNTPGAESIPVHNQHFMTYSASKVDIDFGMAGITGLDRENILRNDQIEFMTEQGWRNLHLAKPIGYYLGSVDICQITLEYVISSDDRSTQRA